jgi:metal-sulfur cluster biosynthetic enzyme
MSEQVPTGSEEELREQDVMEVLRHVYDPELQMDIVELGLVYGVELLPEGRIKVNMTLTSPGCPYGPELVAEVKAMLMMTRGVKGVEVAVVWEPPWGPAKMSEAARLDLGFDV